MSQARKGSQQITGTDYSRHYRGKRKRAKQRIFTRGKGADADVVPVLDKPVKEFEVPPEQCAGDKQRDQVCSPVQ